MKLGDFLNNLAAKSGTTIDFGTLSNLKADEISAIEIDDTVAQAIDTSLMSLDGAKNNPLVANHYKAITLKPFDNKLNALIAELELGDDLLTEQSTFKRLEMSDAKIKAKIAEIKASKGNDGKDEQLKQLQLKLQQISDEKEQAVKAVSEKYENEFTELQIKQMLTGKNYATKDLPVDVNIQVARTLLSSSLQKAGAKLVRKNGELKLVQENNPELDFMDTSNKFVSFDQFTDKVLTDNKLIAVSGATPTQQSQTVQAQVVNTSKLDSATQQAINDLNN